MPPLRDRREDLDALIGHFLAEVGGELRITRDAWRILESYPWPGNVRELRAEVMRWHVFCNRRVRPDDLDPRMTGRSEPPATVPAPAAVRPLAEVVGMAERETGGNLSQAARLLQIDRNTLKRKLRRRDLARRRDPAGRPHAPRAG